MIADTFNKSIYEIGDVSKYFPANKNNYVGCLIKAENAQIYTRASNMAKGYHQYFSEDPFYIVLKEYKNHVMVRHHSLDSGITGFFKKKDIVIIDGRD